MNYYIQAFKRFSDFSGRSRRSEYWYYVLFNILVSIVAVVIDVFIEMPIFTLLYLLVSIIPSIAVLVRRLHDTGKSGWYYFMGMIPIAGPIILLVYLTTDSQPGNNQWGQNPKEIGNDIGDHLVA